MLSVTTATTNPITPAEWAGTILFLFACVGPIVWVSLYVRRKNRRSDTALAEQLSSWQKNDAFPRCVRRPYLGSVGWKHWMEIDCARMQAAGFSVEDRYKPMQGKSQMVREVITYRHPESTFPFEPPVVVDDRVLHPFTEARIDGDEVAFGGIHTRRISISDVAAILLIASVGIEDWGGAHAWVLGIWDRDAKLHTIGMQPAAPSFYSNRQWDLPASSVPAETRERVAANLNSHDFDRRSAAFILSYTDVDELRSSPLGRGATDLWNAVRDRQGEQGLITTAHPELHHLPQVSLSDYAVYWSPDGSFGPLLTLSDLAAVADDDD